MMYSTTKNRRSSRSLISRVPLLRWITFLTGTMAIPMSSGLTPTISALAQQAGAAQEDDRLQTGLTVHPLALKEEMIRDRFQRFEDRVYRLREQLVESEAANAARLGRVLQRAGELGLADQLEALMEILRDPSSLHEALEGQTEWLADADRLLAILLERDSDNEEREREIERLQEYYEKLAKILEQERALRDDTAQGSMTGRMLEQLEQAIRRVDALLNRQEKLAEQTIPARRDSQPTIPIPKGASGLADRQTSLSRDAAQLADDLQRLGELQPDAAADTPSLESARSDTKAAAESVRSGAKAMSNAGKRLAAADAGSAGQQQEQAAEALRQARERLEAAKRRLENQPEPGAPGLAEQQQQIAEDTGNLSNQMRQDAAAGGGQGGPPQADQPGSSSSPGQQSLDQARREMDSAAQALGQSNLDDATQSEDRAIDQLEQARKELEDALTQLRQEEREETLRDLESRFRQMLSEQRAINETTIQLARIGKDNYKRAEHLALAELSTQERALSTDAAVCLHILDEDGTTVVFPRVLEQLSEDMAAVAERLASYNAGALTQAIELEIVDTLEQLLEALQRMQQENEQQGQMQMSGSGQSPLLPESAELKLLRASQMRINTRTVAIESTRREEIDSGDVLAGALQAVAVRQIECAKIAREMRDLQDQP